MKPQNSPSLETNSFSIHVDPSKNPKIMSLIPLNEKMEEDEHRPILLGIYELKGDTLTICLERIAPINSRRDQTRIETFKF